MPRTFVNSMANFVIHGGTVSFTLQDQATRTEGGMPKQAPPDDVADVVMREQDFAQLLAFFNQHVAAFEEQTGRKLGAVPTPGQGGAPDAGRPAAKSQGMKIRAKGT